MERYHASDNFWEPHNNAHLQTCHIMGGKYHCNQLFSSNLYHNTYSQIYKINFNFATFMSNYVTTCSKHDYNQVTLFELKWHDYTNISELKCKKVEHIHTHVL